MTRRRVQKSFQGVKSATKQSFRDDVNIHCIMDRYTKTGVLPSHPGQENFAFGDFSHGYDFQAAVQRIQDCRDDFALLPSRVRDRFGNNPTELLDFLADESNHAEAVELGIMRDLVPDVDDPVEDLSVSKKDDGEAE